MIVLVLGAGVIAAFVKNDHATPAAAPASSLTESVPGATPSATVEASQQLQQKTAVKKASPDELSNVPKLPASGVGRYPIGFVLVAGGFVVARWLRRVARA